MRNVFWEALNEAFDLTDMLARINYHHVRGNLSDADREELIALAREKAQPFGGVDVTAKLAELDARVAKLEKAGVNPETPDTPEVPAYVVGKWYYAGDRVTYNDDIYECIAPEGVVCTWSPDEYPTYWQKVEE